MDGTLLERINLLPIAEAITAGDSVFSDEQRQLIEEAYKSLLGKTIPNCSCRHRYADALVEICHTFKITSKMKCRYKLLAGVIIWLGTECYNNHNLTDEVAEEYLKRFPEAREKEFQAWPEEAPKEDDTNAVIEEAKKCLEESKAALVEYDSEITEESKMMIISCQDTLEEVIAGGDINSIKAAEDGLKQAWKNAEKKSEAPKEPEDASGEDSGDDANGQGDEAGAVEGEKAPKKPKGKKGE